MKTTELLSTATREIEGLHEFFVDWFGGLCMSDDATFNDRFTVRFGPDLVLIQPGGETLGYDALIAGVRGAYGKSPDFHIQIRNVEIQQVLADRYALIRYEEWQRNARNSRPENNGRVSSALFDTEVQDRDGLQWLYIHETWLPEAVMAAGPFDF